MPGLRGVGQSATQANHGPKNQLMPHRFEQHTTSCICIWGARCDTREAREMSDSITFSPGAFFRRFFAVWYCLALAKTCSFVRNTCLER